MNALEAGLRGECPNHLESDFLSVSSVLRQIANFFNPQKVFRGGILRVGSLFPAALRQGAYHCSPALSTRHPDIRDASHGESVVLTGNRWGPVRQMNPGLSGSAQ